MLKLLMTGAAASTLLVGSYALAQQPAAPPKTEMSQPAGGKFVTTQSDGQWLASKFKGTDVIGANNEKIGDVSDILFDHGGKVQAYVVGVGGFLGIGSKDVAIEPASFQVQAATDKENMKLKLAMTKDELKNAPEFKPNKEPARTTMAPSGSRPAMPPATTPPARQ